MSQSIILALVAVTLIPFISIALADNPNTVGIILSQTCLTLIKNNYTTTCPTYEDLLQLDSSDQNITGEFIYKDGIYQRGEPQLRNSWRYYDFDDVWRVYVDPPKGMHERIKLITIQPNFDTYIDRGQNQITNYTIIQYHDRYVNSCHQATINADKWEMLVADTIFYMRKGCDPTFTSFNHTEYIYIPLANHDISTSYKWQLDNWIEDVKKHCIFKFKAC